jgi:hypothetical protein
MPGTGKLGEVRVSKFNRILEEAPAMFSVKYVASIAWPVRFIIPGCTIY